MAFLPESNDGATWLITIIDNNVLIIEHPGSDYEEVHFRLSIEKDDIYKNLLLIKTSDLLTAEQKQWASFWYGYFYGCARMQRV